MSGLAGPDAAALALELRDLEFRYGRDGFALQVPNLRVEAGAHVALIGPSGSGKSTFLALVAGILRADTGELSVLGCDLMRARDAARRRFRVTRIGLVFQEFELLEHLTVRENILLPYFVNAALALGPEVEARLRALAQAAGIDAYLARHPQALSQGERQRVAVCRALIARPALILADEPTGNLDPDTGGRIVELLRDEARRAHATLLMVTHDHGRAHRFERVIDFKDLYHAVSHAR